MNIQTNENQKTATIMLYSGDYDKALFSFIIATGFASLNWKVNLWFTMWGINCIKRRKGIFEILFRKLKGNKNKLHYQNNTYLQNLVELLNRGGANNIPLSNLNMFGLGLPFIKILLKQKNLPTLPEFIQIAEELNINFKICELCEDLLAVSEEDVIVKSAKVYGLSEYALDTSQSDFNTFI